MSSSSINGLSRFKPEDKFRDQRVLVLVPHMDDAVLGCGGTLALMPDKEAVKFVYCTDGRGAMSAAERVTLLNTEKDIGVIRRRETREALRQLGYQPEQIVFLNFDEKHLSEQKDALQNTLSKLIHEFEPDVIFTPNRYDKHPDHITLNRVTCRVASAVNCLIFEYFVYYHWKLLPSGDIRHYMKPEYLLKVDISAIGNKKRTALDCFVSQTTRFYDWQHKPVLSDELLSRFSDGPEVFLHAPSTTTEKELLTLPPSLIHFLNRLEPILKNTKEKLLSIKYCILGDKKVDSRNS